jgi:hypothetical protein
MLPAAVGRALQYQHLLDKGQYVPVCRVAEVQRFEQGLPACYAPTDLSISVADDQHVLGTWLGIYLQEDWVSPHRRALVLHPLGEFARE